MRNLRGGLGMVLVWLSLATGSAAEPAPETRPSDLAHTYSIVARDAETGELGVAVQTHWFAVGRRVTWAEAGVGAVATQSFTNPALGRDGLALLREGKSPQEALDLLLAADDGRAVRQVGVVDAQGRSAAWTGERCIPAAGHHAGEDYAVQANLMANDTVWPAMARAFEASEGPLAERMLVALEAAQSAGGDIRGMQSAALLVVAPESSGKSWQDRRIDLRVDDHPEPLAELARLLRLQRAYEHMNRGDEALESGDVARAEQEYGAAEELAPDNLEMRYWHAVSLANEGLVDDAILLFREVFAQGDNWRELTPRLPGVGLLEVSKEDLARILGEAPASGASAAGLFSAVRAGDLAQIRRLVEGGADLEVTEKWGQTLLHAAATNGRLEAASYLLDQGLDPNREEGFHGGTPLTWALSQGHLEVAVLLLGSDAGPREEALRTALQRESLGLALAAISSGPFLESQLAPLREQAADLGPTWVSALAEADSRPDPPPPALTPAELSRFVGDFEGHTSDRRVQVRVDGDRLTIRIDGGEATALLPVTARQLRSEDDGVAATFWGRAGTIEGLTLRLQGQDPESLRHNVAEPVDTPGVADRLAAAAARSSDLTTVHWPQFRGPHGSGIGDGAETPVAWDLETGQGVRWQAEVPGLGNSSPVVWGDRVFVTTAVADGMEQTLRTGLTGAGSPVEEAAEHSWRVLAFDKHTGEQLWSTEVGRAVPLTQRHFKATQANSTPSTDGEHLVVVFPTAGLACLGLDGAIHWRRPLGGLDAGAFNDPSIQWGFASSPIVHHGRVYLQVDIHAGAYLAAWDLDTGEQLWRTARDVAPSWATPSLARGPAGDELVVNGSTMYGYDPATGRELWSLGPSSEIVIATPIAADGIVYLSAGYPPAKPIYALRLGTRGAIEPDSAEALVWSHDRGGAYMPSPLLYRGLYYVVHHNGRLVAYEAATGAPVYKSRFSKGGTFTGSPIAANGRLYVPTEEGRLYVLAAGPVYEELAVHEVGEPLMATPAVSEGILFLRTSSRLLALGSPTPAPAAR